MSDGEDAAEGFSPTLTNIPKRSRYAGLGLVQQHPIKQQQGTQQHSECQMQPDAYDSHWGLHPGAMAPGTTTSLGVMGYMSGYSWGAAASGSAEMGLATGFAAAAAAMSGGPGAYPLFSPERGFFSQSPALFQSAAKSHRGISVDKLGTSPRVVAADADDAEALAAEALASLDNSRSPSLPFTTSARKRRHRASAAAAAAAAMPMRQPELSEGEATVGQDDERHQAHSKRPYRTSAEDSAAQQHYQKYAAELDEQLPYYRNNKQHSHRQHLDGSNSSGSGPDKGLLDGSRHQEQQRLPPEPGDQADNGQVEPGPAAESKAADIEPRGMPSAEVVKLQDGWSAEGTSKHRLARSSSTEQQQRHTYGDAEAGNASYMHRAMASIFLPAAAVSAAGNSVAGGVCAAALDDAASPPTMEMVAAAYNREGLDDPALDRSEVCGTAAGEQHGDEPRPAHNAGNSQGPEASGVKHWEQLEAVLTDGSLQQLLKHSGLNAQRSFATPNSLLPLSGSERNTGSGGSNASAAGSVESSGMQKHMKGEQRYQREQLQPSAKIEDSSPSDVLIAPQAGTGLKIASGLVALHAHAAESDAKSGPPATATGFYSVSAASHDVSRQQRRNNTPLSQQELRPSQQQVMSFSTPYPLLYRHHSSQDDTDRLPPAAAAAPTAIDCSTVHHKDLSKLTSSCAAGDTVVIPTNHIVHNGTAMEHRQHTGGHLQQRCLQAVHRSNGAGQQQQLQAVAGSLKALPGQVHCQLSSSCSNFGSKELASGHIHQLHNLLDIVTKQGKELYQQAEQVGMGRCKRGFD